MRYASLLLASFSLLSLGCSQAGAPRGHQGASGRYYGGVFNVNESGTIRGLFPLTLTQASEHHIGSQIYEGLVRFDQEDLSIRPALAESWEVDPSGTVYTFKLRQGVRFHDDACFPGGQGRTVNAQDIQDCFTAACTYNEMNLMDWLLTDRVVGANAHYAATMQGHPSNGVKGFEVLAPHTFRITLNRPWPGLLQALAHPGCWIYPRELLRHHGTEARWNAVGTGPFKMTRFIHGKVLVLERNAHFHDTDEFGDQLPFLDAIRYTFVADKNTEMDEFEQGRLSILEDLPVDRTDVLDTRGNGRFQVQSIPGMAVQYYGFNRSLAPFQDVRVRQALSLAIDRHFLADSVLKGMALPATRGMVPPGFTEYPYDTIPELRFDPERARELLAEAGFPEGRGLPTVFLQVNNNGLGYLKVVDHVLDMLERNLGARVVATVLPSDQHYGRIEHGKAGFWRAGWVADHPDPENFLSLFHGRNAPSSASEPTYLNTTRYKDAVYDSLFNKAQRTPDHAERMTLLAMAERRLMEDAVVIPLYYQRCIRLLQPWVRDLPINGMAYRDLRAVWFDPAARNTTR